jgi:signal peptidase
MSAQISHQPKSGYRRAASAVRRLLSSVLVAAGLACGALMLLAGPLGFQRYVITGGSMTGTIARGSIVYDRVVPTESLRVGDVVTYTPPKGKAPPGMVTHRIIWAGRDHAGHRAFRTKGDANESADPWRFVLTSPGQARVAFHVPYAGYVFVALSNRRVRMLVIGVPALLIALSLLAGLWEEAGQRTRGNAPARPGMAPKPRT